LGQKLNLSNLADAEGDRLEEAGELLRAAVRPLYIADDKGKPKDGNPTSWASCLLLSVAGSYFVVTAGHAVREGPDGGSVFFLGREQLSPFATGAWISSSKGDNAADDDPLDFAFVKLPRGSEARIDGPLFLAPSNIASGALPLHGAKYIAFGYPSSKQERRVPGRVYDQTPFAFGLPEVSEDCYAKLAPGHIDRWTHVVVSFDQQQSMYQRGVLVRPPTPEGMSGGGLRLLGDPLWRIGPHTLPKLHGILLGYRRSPSPMMVAVRIGVVLSLMVHVYPDLYVSLRHLLPEGFEWERS
jgi:hypothetical protein